MSAPGTPITMVNGKLNVPENPTICFIEGDGIGKDIWATAQAVFDAAVEKAYGGKRKVAWHELFAGEKANERAGKPVWLPQETLDDISKYLVAIKGPLTTPVGGGIRSINVALRQQLDLYACLRPVKYFTGVPSPVKEPEKVDMTIFRENCEDIYAGIEYADGTPERDKLRDFLMNEMGVTKIRFPETSGLGIKPISREGTERLVRSAMEYAVANGLKKLTIIHKGNIMKFTEGAWMNWGYDLIRKEFGDVAEIAEDVSWKFTDGKIQVTNVIADNFLQQILLRPEDYDVICATNLNGDYISDALAAQVGGIGIAPGANINYTSGHAVFEATHGTAPKYAGLNKVNPSSVILSGEMMFRYLGWTEAADMILRGVDGAIQSKNVTYDFARDMDGATEVSTSGFGEEIIKRM